MQTPAGVRFALATYPRGTPRGGWLYVHPFAEEMNKSRRMAALAARAFAEDGWLVLQLDLAGCGDSAGDFGDASWQGWLDDVSHGWTWLTEHCTAPCGLWTLRAGSLLAADWVGQSGETPPLLLWQPVARGQQHLIQFLRLKAANSMLDHAGKRGITTQLRKQLAASRSVEVAGYRLSPSLAAGLEAAALRLPPGYPSCVALFEIASDGHDELSAPNAKLIMNWREEKIPISAERIAGHGFWQSLEIEVVPQLIVASRQAIQRVAA